MANKSKTEIINNEDEHIIVKETPVHISDEKMKSVLYRTYEQAQKDLGKRKLYDHYGCFFSVSGTLFISLASASFHDFLFFSKEECTMVVKICFGLSLVMGILSLFWKLKIKSDNDTTCRDNAVDAVFDKYIKGD